MIAFITGATAGIGQATAELFAKNGYNIIITGRRKERLDEFSAQLKSAYKIDVLCLHFDVRKLAEVEKAIASIPADWRNINVLVNNAGLAVGLNSIQEGVIDDWERMIDTNVKGLLYMTRTLAPIMIANGHGHIVNIGSIAGKEVYANGNVYCATKHAVDVHDFGCMGRQWSAEGGHKLKPGLDEIRKATESMAAVTTLLHRPSSAHLNGAADATASAWAGDMMVFSGSSLAQQAKSGSARLCCIHR